MPIDSSWRPLRATEIERVPEDSGVYEIANLVRTTICIGSAEEGGLRAALAAHLDAPTPPLARHAGLYFRYETSNCSARRLAELIEEYRRRHRGATPPGDPAPSSQARRAAALSSRRPATTTRRPAYRAA